MRLVTVGVWGLIAVGFGSAIAASGTGGPLLDAGGRFVERAIAAASPAGAQSPSRGTVVRKSDAALLTLALHTDGDALGPPAVIAAGWRPGSVSQEASGEPPAAAVRLAQAGESGGKGRATGSTRAPDDEPVRRLTRSIQSELTRVGCYSGAVDGEWSTETRKAMQAFNERVNASLPINQPDYILLTLLQGHAAKACGALCPAGQARADNGSCQPRSVIAAQRREPSSGTTGSVPAVAPNVDAETARRASSARIDAEAETLARRKAAAEEAKAAAETARIKAEQTRARLEQEQVQREKQRLAEIEDQKRLVAQAKARAAAEEREYAERERQRIAAADEQKRLAAERQRAELERQRIAAAEAVKQQQIAEAKARAEAERVARLAAAERARAEAEARQRAIMADLAAKAARPPQNATPVEQVMPSNAATLAAASVPAAPARPTPAPTPAPAPVAADVPQRTPQPARRVAAPKVVPKPAEARYVGRFVPPPPYRVGRIPPGARTEAPAPRAAPTRLAGPARQNVQAVFRYVARHSP